jgi:hypothetical protein
MSNDDNEGWVRAVAIALSRDQDIPVSAAQGILRIPGVDEVLTEYYKNAAIGILAEQGAEIEAFREWLDDEGFDAFTVDDPTAARPKVTGHVHGRGWVLEHQQAWRRFYVDTGRPETVAPEMTVDPE